jgi:hypothetical protein
VQGSPVDAVYLLNEVKLFNIVGIEVIAGVVAFWSNENDISLADCPVGRIVVIARIVEWI